MHNAFSINFLVNVNWGERVRQMSTLVNKGEGGRKSREPRGLQSLTAKIGGETVAGAENLSNISGIYVPVF